MLSRTHVNRTAMILLLKYEMDLVKNRGNSGTLPQINNVDNEWNETYDITDKVLSCISEKGSKTKILRPF